MPYTMKKVKGGRYRVTGPGGVHAKGSTKANAESQMRLLRAVEHNPDWKPTGKRASKKLPGIFTGRKPNNRARRKG